MKNDFSDLLHVPTREEMLATFRCEPKKWTLYPATAKEIQRMLLSWGFPSADFERIGNNVVIADGSVVVVIKKEADREPQTLSIWDNPRNEYWRDDLDGKMWANKEVMFDIERAFNLLNMEGGEE